MPPPRDLLRALPVFAADLPHFDAGQTSADPVPLFTTWLLAALDAGVPEPHAMTLATVDGAGRPSTRVLICKDVGAAGHWYFASGAASRKGRELATAPGAALGFHWPQLGRQIRIRGTATSTGAERSAADFLARSPGARAESLAGRQSDVLDDPGDVEDAVSRTGAELGGCSDLGVGAADRKPTSLVAAALLDVTGALERLVSPAG